MMNAMEAANKIDKLNEQINAIARIAYYLKDNGDLDREVDHIGDIKDGLQREFDILADKLRSVQL
jgi:hypothetical protein